ncbi:MAG: hypothetical protein E7033_00430 [Akkermansiaceae bacterium]|nr:hypothetical protein [Akkermansiaceae bacterium]
MKSTVLKALVLSGILSVTAHGLSLYDSAPPIGLPDSHAVRFGAYVNAGYDSNLNNSARNEEDGGFVRYGLTASYADYESATKVSYNARLGGQLYDKDAYGTDKRDFSDISLSGHLSHAFGPDSQYVASASLSYCPEPDYSNGISAPLGQGDCLTWHISNAYSRMIDCRWSWTANVSYNGNVYTDSRYEVDDRTYLSGGLSLNYRYDTRTTYALNTTWRHEDRSEGFDSDSWFTNLSVAHSLSPTDSLRLAVGVQAKFIDGETNLYPTVDFSYRRVLTEGLSARAYVRFSNENLDTYYHYNSANYRSNETWRAGVGLSYVLSPVVSFSADLAMISSSYSDGTKGLRDYDRTTWSAGVGMNYKFTKTLSGNIRYTHTLGDTYGGYDEYDRDVISAGLSYSF